MIGVLNFKQSFMMFRLTELHSLWIAWVVQTASSHWSVAVPKSGCSEGPCLLPPWSFPRGPGLVSATSVPSTGPSGSGVSTPAQKQHQSWLSIMAVYNTSPYPPSELPTPTQSQQSSYLKRKNANKLLLNSFWMIGLNKSLNPCKYK